MTSRVKEPRFICSGCPATNNVRARVSLRVARCHGTGLAWSMTIASSKRMVMSVAVLVISDADLQLLATVAGPLFLE